MVRTDVSKPPYAQRQAEADQDARKYKGETAAALGKLSGYVVRTMLRIKTGDKAGFCKTERARMIRLLLGQPADHRAKHAGRGNGGGTPAHANAARRGLSGKKLADFQKNLMDQGKEIVGRCEKFKWGRGGDGVFTAETNSETLRRVETVIGVG
jgi:hypothetical protein